jgi:Protein of unknown function with PCYCGC motif
MDRKDDKIHHLTRTPALAERRSFLAAGALTIATLVLSPLLRRCAFGATEHRYELAPESVLPADIRRAPVNVREAYRFAVANRDVLRYIPCYCGCGAAGHTSNASCYVKDSSTPDHIVFDRMSLG